MPKFEVAEGATETLHRHPSLLAAAPVAARQAAPSAVVDPAAVLADGDVARAPHLAAGLGLVRVIDSCGRAVANSAHLDFSRSHDWMICVTLNSSFQIRVHLS